MLRVIHKYIDINLLISKMVVKKIIKSNHIGTFRTTLTKLVDNSKKKNELEEYREKSHTCVAKS